MPQAAQQDSQQSDDFYSGFLFFMVTFSVISDIPSSLSYAFIQKENHSIKTYKTYYDILL